MKTNNRAKGMAAEDLAVRTLTENGYTIIARNYYSKYGELDIIANDGEDLAIIEVKYRKTTMFGTPAAAVTYTKRKRIIQTTRCYMAENNIEDVGVRFDVVEVYGDLSVNILKGAFIEE